MFRLILIHCLTWNILTCPFNCMGEVQDSVDESIVEPCCSHCCSDNKPPAETPPGPCNDCDCVCFCNGAVITEQAVDLPDADILIAAVCDPEAKNFAFTPGIDGLVFPESLGIPSGRLQRILFESYLL